MTERPDERGPAVVLAGGMGLGAYQAGAYEELAAHGYEPSWLAGSSAGAVNAALIAGNPPDGRVAALRRFWLEAEAWPDLLPPLAPPGSSLRHVRNWLSAIQARLTGARGHFRPRLPGPPLAPFRSLYDLSPMCERLKSLVDFARVNAGTPRLSVATTDIETGEPVVFDTGAGDTIEMDHLLASCGFIPEFAPVEIGGRLLGDGGLSMNAPVEAVVRHKSIPFVLVLDLFARDGGRPTSLEAALARKNDLIFANQTLVRLEALQQAGAREKSMPPILYLSYRAPPDEAGPEKTFDLSARTAKDRWEAGRLDMAEALRRVISVQTLPALQLVRRDTGA